MAVHLMSSEMAETHSRENALAFFLTEDGYADFHSNRYDGTKLTIHHFKPQFHQDQLQYLLTIKTNFFFEKAKSCFFYKFKQEITEEEKNALLHSKKYKLFFDDIKEQSQKEAKRCIKKIAEGHSLGDAQFYEIDFGKLTFNLRLIEPDESYCTSVRVHPPAKKVIRELEFVQKMCIPTIGLEKQKNALRALLFIKRSEAEEVRRHQKHLASIYEYFDQMRYFCFLSAKLNKYLDQLTLTDRDAEENKKAFEDFKRRIADATQRQKELEIQDSFQPLVEPKKSQRKKQQKARTKAKGVENAAPKVEKVERVVLPPFFPSQSLFSIDYHVFRWFSASDLDIQGFEDKPRGETIKRYATLPPEERQWQKVCHKLRGVDRLMSIDPRNLERYSRPYQFDDHGKLREGRCFLANLQQGSIQEQGMIYVGVDNRRIYHAHFVPFSKARSETAAHPQDLCIPLDGFDAGVPAGKWEMKGGYHFEREGETIVWSIEGDVRITIDPLF